MPEEHLLLGVIQTTVDADTAWASSLKMSAVEEESVVAELQQHLASLAAERPKPHIVLIPELSVPLGFLPRLRSIAIEMNAVIIGGLDFEQQSPGNQVVNRAIAVIPNGWGRRSHSTTSTVRYIGKTYAAWRENDLIQRHHCIFRPIPEVWIFDAGEFGRFAVAMCFDFLDLERVAMYRLQVQHLFILAYNTDIPTFDHTAEALARMIFCNIAVCNTGRHGGSIAVSPYSRPERRLIYRHSGIGLATSQTIKLPVSSLMDAQRGNLPQGAVREFKNLPPSALNSVPLHREEASL